MKSYRLTNARYIFQDLVAASNLLSYLNSKNGRLSEAETAVIIQQVLAGLQFLHSQHIVHRDLTPDNVLIAGSSSGSRVVLTGFGMARRLNVATEMTSMVRKERSADLYVSDDFHAAR